MRADCEERAPCGVAGGLIPVSHGMRALPDLSDCLVARPRDFRLVIWEPLPTKAPSPPKAHAFCCYSRTVIFYHAPYIPALAKRYWRTPAGELRASSGGFEQWDQIEFRLGWDDVVAFDGERFVVACGTVVWTRRRWWMFHGARRVPA